MGREILHDDLYEIEIKAFNLEDMASELLKERIQKKEAEEADRDFEEEVLNVKDYINDVAWLPRIATDCIYYFFVTIKNDMAITGYKLDTLKVPRDSISTRVLNVLHKFSHEVKKGKDLEEMLLDYIEDMREFILYPPIEDLEKELWDLRSYKIEFFKRVLEEYRKNKEEYDKILENEIKARNDLKREIKEIDGHKGKKIEETMFEEEIYSHILLEDTYEMNINAFNIRKLTTEIEKEKERRRANGQDEGELDYEEAKWILNVKPFRDNIACLPRIAIDCIYNFFISIKDDMGITRYNKLLENTNIKNRVLAVLSKFLTDFTKGSDMEELLLDYIEGLKEFNLYPPIKNLEKELWNLRSYKIEFFKRVLEEYRKDKEGYEKYL